MTGHHLPAVLFALLVCWSPFVASDSFLSDSNVIKKDKVQNVLEHQPAKAPECQHTVRTFD